MSYLDQISPEYLEELLELYKTDPKRLPASWRLFFDGMEFGLSEVNPETHVNGHTNGHVGSNGHTPLAAATPNVEVITFRSMAFVDACRRYAHQMAQTNPLEDDKPLSLPVNLEQFGLSSSTNDKFQSTLTPSLNGLTPSQISDHMKRTYAQYIGCEFMHIEDHDVRDWFVQKIEANQNRPQFSPEEKWRILDFLMKAENFESFLQKNYTGQKRFSLEGGESLLPALDAMNEVLAQKGAEEVVIGMAHRGRLNVLTNILKKPYGAIFAEFDGLYFKDGDGGGDVKYHLGFSNDLDYGGKKLHLSLAFNPSHLEVVNSVVEGMTRAKQFRHHQKNPDRVVPILIHGDAAMIGQGVVAETFSFSQIEGYKVGGSIHVVINNQVGFTTDAIDGRSSRYCSDFAKTIQAPVFHVNGNKPEYVTHVAKLAAEFRATFHRDVVIDIVCYRKYGHNEGDEPRFTQPLMYEKIAKVKSPYQSYSEDLLQTSVATPEKIKSATEKFNQDLTNQLAEVKAGKIPAALSPFKGYWENLTPATKAEMLIETPTPIHEAVFKRVIDTIHEPSLKALPKLLKMFEARKQAIEKNDTIDWAVGEQLAYGSLLTEGFSVRLSGQDARRGTFSHRHAALVNPQTGENSMPLERLTTNGAFLEIWNSPLSEFAVMGFDYGYSLSDPKCLVLWEAQFGDFANGAQVIIDQFISASERKWHRYSGLTLLLPHGYEGQGPEHSSARLERYLQLCALGNMQVAYPTTPAQFCHLLRRQLVRPFRKPLIVMTPKSPLRMPEVVSHKKDFIDGGFQNILVTGAPAETAERFILCTGKVYWDLMKFAKENSLDKTTAFARVELLYPLDEEKLKKLKIQYSQVKDWVWVQEEPMNTGAWTFMVLNTMDLLKLRYAGRKPSSSVATGSPKIHAQEQMALVKDAFQVK